jgi:AraC family transcriptional activator of tynA and feaB
VEKDRRLGENGDTGARNGGGAFATVSTDRLPSHERFDFWRSVFPHMQIDLVERSQLKEFRAGVQRRVTPEGIQFGRGLSQSSVISKYSQPQGEFISLSLSLTGSGLLLADDGRVHRATPASGLVVLDTVRPVTVVSEDHTVVGLTIPREMVVEAVGGEQHVPRTGTVLPSSLGLSQLLTAHMHELARVAGSLDAPSADIAINVAVDLALGAFKQMGNGQLLQEGNDKAVLAAARRYIDEHCADPGLTAPDIARTIGCSRTYLYRVFAAHDMTIGETIRTVRLERAQKLLVSAPELPVQVVAYRCGYASSASFSRAFRDAMGQTPTDFRHAATDQSGAV